MSTSDTPSLKVLRGPSLGDLIDSLKYAMRPYADRIIVTFELEDVAGVITKPGSTVRLIGTITGLSYVDTTTTVLLSAMLWYYNDGRQARSRWVIKDSPYTYAPAGERTGTFTLIPHTL